MEIRPIQERSVWNDFFDAAGSPSFHHSWEWGEFQQSHGSQIMRLGVYDGTDLFAILLVVKIKSRRGKILFIPHGPIFLVSYPYLTTHITAENETRFTLAYSTLTRYLTDIARQEGFACIRISPVFDDRPEHYAFFQSLGYRNAPIYMHAERMQILALRDDSHKPLSEDLLLANMRKTTRYSIKKSEREGVHIDFSRTGPGALEDFQKIYAQTASREQFTPFSHRFIQAEWEAFSSSGNALFAFASHQGTDLAGALILFTKSAGYYHQGASTHSKIPAPYLLQWHALLEAQKRGCSYYNFWGTHRPGRTPASWSGLSLFKEGFGGKEIDYMFTQDFIVSPLYYLNFAAEKYLNWKRGV